MKLRAKWSNVLQMWVTRGGFLLNCGTCGILVSMPRWGAAWCSDHEPLWSKREKVTRPAHTRVAAAIRRGELARPSVFQCVDCDKPAACYDHRNYDKPLDVVPVCRSCNVKRGSAVHPSLMTPRHARSLQRRGLLRASR